MKTAPRSFWKYIILMVCHDVWKFFMYHFASKNSVLFCTSKFPIICHFCVQTSKDTIYEAVLYKLCEFMTELWLVYLCWRCIQNSHNTTCFFRKITIKQRLNLVWKWMETHCSTKKHFKTFYNWHIKFKKCDQAKIKIQLLTWDLKIFPKLFQATKQQTHILPPYEYHLLILHSQYCDI